MTDLVDSWRILIAVSDHRGTVHYTHILVLVTHNAQNINPWFICLMKLILGLLVVQRSEFSHCT